MSARIPLVSAISPFLGTQRRWIAAARSRIRLQYAVAVPFTARRILIAGVTGSGKTTLAGRVGRILGIPRVEMDDLHWGPGWTTRPDFLEKVVELAHSEAWITEWQYREARPIVLDRAEALVWIDLPTRVQLWRLLRRTISRRVKRTPMWRAGMVEQPLWTVFTDPDHILRWGWRTRNTYRDEYAAVIAELRERDGFEVVRLRSARDVEEWAASLGVATR